MSHAYNSVRFCLCFRSPYVHQRQFEPLLRSPKFSKVKLYLFSRGHATLHLAVSVGRSVRPSVTFLNSEHYCPCPTVRDWIAVYPALLSYQSTPEIQILCASPKCLFIVFSRGHATLLSTFWSVTQSVGLSVHNKVTFSRFSAPAHPFATNAVKYMVLFQLVKNQVGKVQHTQRSSNKLVSFLVSPKKGRIRL